MFRCVAVWLLSSASVAFAAQVSKDLHVGMTITGPVTRGVNVRADAVSPPGGSPAIPLPPPRPASANEN